MRLALAAVRLRMDSPQAALLVLSPVQESQDPQVQGLMAKARASIAKGRSF